VPTQKLNGIQGPGPCMNKANEHVGVSEENPLELMSTCT
jgi:hypothetical protein